VSTVPFPDASAYDLVLPLGSVHSVYDHGTIGSWIHRELEVLADAHHSGVPLLGICFGCQALAAALGGSVERAPQREIGFLAIESDVDAIEPGPWLSWHDDRVVLPHGATELARTPVCTQAWRLGRTAAVQFHPEVDGDVLTMWVEGAGPRYFADAGVDPVEMVSIHTRERERLKARCDRLVDWYLEEVAAS
jgi:GMP synthase-like glutamine amidotransferase